MYKGQKWYQGSKIKIFGPIFLLIVAFYILSIIFEWDLGVWLGLY